MSKCEFPECENDLSCFHYCAEHHKAVCVDDATETEAQLRVTVTAQAERIAALENAVKFSHLAMVAIGNDLNWEKPANQQLADAINLCRDLAQDEHDAARVCAWDNIASPDFDGCNGCKNACVKAE
jgi:hypothetical protein